MNITFVPLVAVTAAALVLSGCASSTGTTDAAPTPTATAENPYGGFPVDPPAADEVVLTIVGTSTVDLTYAELKDLATVKVTLSEPFVGAKQSFTGVPLADLFAMAGIQPTDKVDTVALNDYHFADTAGDFETADGLLAVLRDGEDIPMDQGGPIRIVFGDDSTYSTNLDAWNWSIRSLEVVQG